MVYPRAGGDDAHVPLTGLPDRDPELAAQPVAHHGKQVAARLARRHLQIAVCRSRVIQALARGIDQDRSRRIGVEQRPRREVARIGARRAGAPEPVTRQHARAGAEARSCRRRPGVTDMPKEPVRL